MNFPAAGEKRTEPAPLERSKASVMAPAMFSEEVFRLFRGGLLSLDQSRFAKLCIPEKKVLPRTYPQKQDLSKGSVDGGGEGLRVRACCARVGKRWR
jgi:hypothetical protein